MTTEQITGIGEILASITRCPDAGELKALQVNHPRPNGWSHHPQITEPIDPSDIIVVTAMVTDDEQEHTGVTVLRSDGTCRANFDAQ